MRRSPALSPVMGARSPLLLLVVGDENTRAGGRDNQLIGETHMSLCVPHTMRGRDTFAFRQNRRDKDRDLEWAAGHCPVSFTNPLASGSEAKWVEA